MPFLNQRMKDESDRRNNLMTNLLESYMVELGFELVVPKSAIRHATDYSMKPDTFVCLF